MEVLLLDGDVDPARIAEVAPQLLQDSDTHARAANALLCRIMDALMMQHTRTANCFLVMWSPFRLNIVHLASNCIVQVLYTCSFQRILCSHSRRSSVITRQLLEIVLSVDCGLESLIESIASLCAGEQQELDDVVGTFKHLLSSDRALLVPIIAAMAQLPLDQNLREQTHAMAVEVFRLFDTTHSLSILLTMLYSPSRSLMPMMSPPSPKPY
jgi:hypothetical protein